MMEQEEFEEKLLKLVRDYDKTCPDYLAAVVIHCVLDKPIDIAYKECPWVKDERVMFPL